MENFEEKIKEIVSKYCGGSVTEFARQLGMQLEGKPMNDSSVQAWIRPNPRTGRPSEPNGSRRKKILKAIAELYPVSEEWLEGKEGSPQAFEIPFLEVGAGDGGSGELLKKQTTSYLRTPLPDKYLGKNLKAVTVVGESMIPDLKDRDLVIIDTAQKEVREGLYVVSFEGAPLIKFVQFVSSNRINLLSKNKLFPPVEVNLTHENFKVYGKVVAKFQALV